MKLSLLILALAVATAISQQAGGYTQLDAAEIQNDATIQYLANFGAQSVAQEAIQAGDLPAAQYNISRVYSVSRQVVNGFNYKFDVEISNPQGDSTRATYTVYYQPSTNDEEVTSFTYVRAPGLDGIMFSGQDDSDVDYSDNQALLGPDVIIGEEASELEWLGEAWIAGEDEYAGEEGGLVGGYSPVDLGEFNNNQEAQRLLVFGLQYVIKRVIDRGDLEEDYPFELAQIYSVSEQVVSGMNYQYDVGIDNRNGTTARLLFVVYSQPWTGTQRVSSFNYTVTTVSNGPPVTLGSNSETEISADDALTDDNDDTDDVGGFQEVDATQANNDTTIQRLKNLGAQYVAEQGIASGALPQGQYQVSQTFGVFRQVVSGTNYKFDVELDDGQGKKVRAQYIVYSQPWTNTETVTSYRFTS